MFFAILLIGPTSLFTNARPADDPDSSLQAEYAAFADENCPTGPNDPFRSGFITPADGCVSLFKLRDPNDPNAPPQISGFKSGFYSLAPDKPFDTTNYACKLSYYTGTLCLGIKVGETETIVPTESHFGSCVNFELPPDIFLPSVPVPDALKEANSVKMTCHPK